MLLLLSSFTKANGFEQILASLPQLTMILAFNVEGKNDEILTI